MEQVLDALKRIITRWTRTNSVLIEDMSAGSDTVVVRTSKRFRKNDEVLLRGPTTYEKPANLRVDEVLDNNTIRLNQVVQNNWTVDNGSILEKTMNGQFVQGIYIGDPENIPKFPAITINGISEESEWLTLDSVKDTYNVEIGIFVEDSTQEDGYRVLMRLTKLIKIGLARNIFPLINDYETVAITEDTTQGDRFVKVSDTSIFCLSDMVLIEDQYISFENRIKSIDTDTNTLEFSMAFPTLDLADNPVVIRPRRFIFNSYPKSIQYGKIHKGTLLKASVINWFGQEEVVNPTGGGGWSDPSLK